MMDKDKDSETLLPEEQVTPPATASIPATLDDLKKLESSIMSQMQAMLAGFLGPKENPLPSAVVSPSKVSAEKPLIVFVPKKGKPLEEEKVGDIGTSTNGEEVSKDKRDSDDSHAVPPPNNYSPNPPIHMTHIVSQGPPPALDKLCKLAILDAITYSQLFDGIMEDNQGRLQAIQPRQPHDEGGGGRSTQCHRPPHDPFGGDS